MDRFNSISNDGARGNSSTFKIGMNKSKQRQFYRAFKTGLLDEERITDDGWKSLYEYELEKGYSRPEDLPVDIVNKYNIDLSISKPVEIEPIIDTTIEEPIEDKKEGFFSKILNSLKNIQTSKDPEEPIQTVQGNREIYEKADTLRDENLKSIPRFTYEGLNPEFGNIGTVVKKDNDPLLMALNNMTNPNFIGQETKNIIDMYNREKFNEQRKEEVGNNEFYDGLPQGINKDNGYIEIGGKKYEIDKDMYFEGREIKSDNPKDRTSSQKVKDVLKSIDEGIKAFGYGLVDPIISSGRRSQREILDSTMKPFEKMIEKDPSKHSNTESAIKDIRESMEYWTEERLFNSFLGKKEGEGITKGEKVGLAVGSFAGNLGKLLLFSKVIGTPTSNPLVNKGIVGAVSGAESSYGRGEDPEDIVKEAIISSGSFIAGGLASEVVGDKLTKSLVDVYNKHPEWANHLTALVRTAKGFSHGSTGTAARIGLSNLVDKDTELKLSDAIQSGVIMGLVEGITSYVPWHRFVKNENEMKQYNVNLKEVDENNLVNNGYLKLSSIIEDEKNLSNYGLDPRYVNPYANDIYINPSTKDIVVVATREGAYLVPRSMAEGKFDNESFNINRELGVNVGPRTQDVKIGKFSGDENFSINRSNLSESQNSWVKSMTEKGYKEFKPGLWVLEKDGKLLDVVPEFTASNSGKPIPLFNIESEGKSNNTNTNDYKGFLGNEYDLSNIGKTNLHNAGKFKDLSTEESLKNITSNKNIDKELSNKFTDNVKRIDTVLKDLDSAEKLLDNSTTPLTEEYEVISSIRDNVNKFIDKENISKTIEVIKEASLGKSIDPSLLQENIKKFNNEFEIHFNGKKIEENIEDKTPLEEPIKEDLEDVNIKGQDNIKNATKEAIEPTIAKDKIKGLEFKAEMTNYHNGQSDMILSAKKDGKAFGNVEYSDYKGDIYINHIFVPEEERRQGVATSLLQELQRQYPDKEIHWGGTTKDGTALKEAITYEIDNEETSPMFIQLEEYKKELEEINNRVEDGIMSDEDGERWNYLHDNIAFLENELNGKSPTKTMIKLDEATEGPKIQSDITINTEGQETIETPKIEDDSNTIDSENKPTNIGYHAGDLGKAESYSKMVGSNRGTGHFGTGTYFVGNKEILRKGNYKDRPLHKIDFSGYNLFKPIDGRSSYRLHNALKFINKYSNSMELLDINEPNDKYSQKDIDRFNNDYEYFQEDLTSIPNIRLNKAIEIIKNNNEKAINELGENWFYDTKASNYDSPSTMFMKSLGYEGIDVRHLEEFDNTDYGSVIYDLKQTTMPTDDKKDTTDTKGQETIKTPKAEDDKPIEREYKIVRIDSDNAVLNPSEKPQGLYVSITDDADSFESPHEVGETKYTGTARPKNTLVIEDTKIKHNRFGRKEEGYGSAGVIALKKLVNEDEFNNLLNMGKKELISLLDEKYPGPDYTKYYDSYELLEAYGGQLAKENGYDSIILEDKEFPELSELVVLDDRIIDIKTTRPTEGSKELVGNTATTTTNDGKKVEVEYKVVSSNDLIASHTTSLHKNENYPEELQPRDRSKKTSILQVDNIINNLNPEWLGESQKVSDGSPIIGSDNVVESGNGRVIALQKMYENNHDSKEKYIKWLNENKEKFGITGNLPNNPILVRVRKSDIDRVEFTRIANVSDVSSLSIIEQAKIDSEKLNSDILNYFVPNDEGKINTKDNKKFISSFVEKVIPKEEHGKYIDNNGNITQDGISRIRNAIFYFVYNDENILSKVAESLDNNIKTITNAMLNIAPRLANIKHMINKGTLHNLDFSLDIRDSVNKYISLKEDNISVNEFISQVSLFSNEITDEAKVILFSLEEHNRSIKRLMKYFNYIFEGIGLSESPNQLNLLGDVKVEKIDILDYAERRFKLDEKGIIEGQTEIFEEIKQTDSIQDVKDAETEGVTEEVKDNKENYNTKLSDYGIEVILTKTKNNTDVWHIKGNTYPYKEVFGRNGMKAMGYGKGKNFVWSFKKSQYETKEELEKKILDRLPPLEGNKTDLETSNKVSDVEVQAIDKTPEIEEDSPTEVEFKPSQLIANEIIDKLNKGEKISFVELFNISDKAYNGTQADGTYSVKDAYDSLELGVNQYLLMQNDIDLKSNDSKVVEKNIVKLEKLLELLPTQTKRTKEMEDFQQFSTPPNISYIANYLANVNKNDTMLEPSAGIGGLAIFSKIKGAKVIVNELSERRLDILKNIAFDEFYNENAEQLNNILPDRIKPTVIVMNPPFSSTAGRVSKNQTKFATKHLEEALLRLEDNGRLVAIVGNTMGEDFKQFDDFWKDIKSKYNVRANITIDGKNYRKYGTSYDVNILVIDKTGPTTEKTITDKFEDLKEIISRLEGINSDRPETIKETGTTEQNANKSTSQERISEEESIDRRRETTSSSNDELGARESTDEIGTKEGTGRDIDKYGNVEESTISNERTPGRGTESDTRRDEGEEDNRGNVNVSTGDTDIKTRDIVYNDSELEITVKEESKKVDKENIDKVFSEYTPQKLKIKGSKPHKGKLSESTAMGAVSPPDPTYVPNLPKELIQTGNLSDAQLESVVYAGQAHEQILPNGNRRGFFIGDGTGVGKGREISGIIFDNFNQGRRKAIWVTKNNDLFPDAQRDLEGVGMDSKLLFKLPKLSEKINKDEGVLFVGYGTLITNLSNSRHHARNKNTENYKPQSPSRIDQIIEWLGKDFDGVIAFDEAHKMANAITHGSGRGKREATATSLAGQLLQSALPKARVVYVSATGASEIHNLAYLERLGLWGEGTAFADVNSFIESIGSGGLASMELVARDMKALGVYLSRSLSYDGVTYERLEHNLTKDQNEIYDVLSNAWQIVMQNVEEALKITESGSNAKRNARGQFWSSQQRFFNQILTSMSMPSVIESIRKNVDDGNSVVIQLTNTNEAMQERQISKAMEDNLDLEDIDMSPKDILIQYLSNAYPVQQYEEYEDENGNKKTRPVFDSNGKPVLNKEAVRSRDRLIAMVGSINMPDSPLDMIINTFGPKNVTEITGRKRRIVKTIDKSTGIEKAKIEKRSDTVRDKDLDDFINDKKRILIFSEAGGTGKSYHASNEYKNNRKRTHYILQAGFSAISAMQGLGRTHRTNQAHTPHVMLVTTNIAGHKRFISTIARRLDQLGALTKGQRQAGTQGLFGEKDNLEGPTAIDSLRTFYRQLGLNRLPGLDRDEVLNKMGLYNTLVKDDGYMVDESDVYTDVKKFLNRLLVLDTELQDRVFNAYAEILDDTVQKAIDNGTLDVGLENFVADNISIDEEITVRTDEKTDAETKYISFNVKEKTKTLSFDEINTELESFKGFYKNTRSGIVRAYFVSRSVTDDKGKVEKTYRSYEPEMGKIQRVTESDLEKDTMEKISNKEAKLLWNKQLKELPEFKESKIHLITGVLLPIWDRLETNDRPRIMRVITDEGKEYLGRLLKEEHVNMALTRLGAESKSKEINIKDAINKVMKQDYTIYLSNGWKIKRSRVSGEYRFEILGPSYSHFNSLEKLGVFTEVIQYKTRFFIPGIDFENILTYLNKNYPITNIIKSEAASNTLGFIKNDKEENKGNKTKDKVKPISNIISDIERDFNISVSSKRYRNRRGEIGQYQIHSESIRVKEDNDINTIAHELGHHLDKKYNFSTKHSNLIDKMKDNLGLSSEYKEHEIPGEVIAEFIRLYLISENKSKELNEEFHTIFIETLDSKDLKNLNKHREDIINWYGSTINDRVESTIKSHTDKKNIPLDTKMLNMEMEIFDDLAPLRRLSEWIEKTTGDKLNFAENIYVLGLHSRRAGMIAKSQIVYAQSDTEGNIIGESLYATIKDVKKTERNAFDGYLKVKHAITLNEFDKQVFSSDFSLDDLYTSLNNYEKEYPHFKEASERLYNWWNTFVEEWVVNEGFLSREAWIDLQSRYPTYVPNFRVMDDTDIKKGNSKRGFGNQSTPIKRMKGSSKDTYSAIESIVLYTDKVVKTQMRNKVGLALHDLYNKVEGLGEFITKVSHESELHKFNAISLKDTLKNLLIEDYIENLPDDKRKKANKILKEEGYESITRYLASEGILGPEIIDSTMDDIITYFTPRMFSTDGSIYTVIDKKGKTHFYEVHDPLLLEAMLNLNDKKMDKYVEAIGKWKRIFTNLTTGANPIFGIVSNIWGDVPQAYAMGSYKTPLDFGKALGESMIEVFKKDEEVLKYYSMGGGLSSPISENRKLMEETLNTLFPEMKKTDIKSMVEYGMGLIEQFNDTIETAPRYSEFKKVLSKYGDTYEGRLRAIYEAGDVTVNFLRRGRIQSTIIGQGTPFLNAGLQGLYKLNQEFIRRKGPGRNDISGDGGKGKDNKKLLSILFKALMGITTFEILQMIAYNDDEDYSKMSDYIKDNYWLIKYDEGKFIRIRKPRELGLMFSTMFRRGFKSVFENDPKGWNNFSTTFMNMILPPNPITDSVFGPFIEVVRNRSWRDTPIIPKRLEDLPYEEQYDTNTSEIAKILSRLVPKFTGNVKSPKAIDYIIGQYTGIIGQIALPATTESTSVLEALGRKVTTDVSYSNDLVNSFYETKEKLDTAHKLYNDKGKVTKDFDPVTRHRYNEVGKELSDLWKEIDQIKKDDTLSKDKKKNKEREIRLRMVELTSDENLKATAYDEFKVLYAKAKDITDRFKEEYKTTKQRPKLTKEEETILILYNVAVDGNRSQLSLVNSQLNEIKKRKNQLLETDKISYDRKNKVMNELSSKESEITNRFMTIIKDKYNINIKGLFK